MARADRSDEIMQAWLRERPDLDPSSVAVITRIWQLAKIFDDERRELLVGHGIDRAIMDLLGTLRRAGDPHALTTRELAARTGVTPAAISQRVGRAEASGWVARTTLAHRHVRVQLTDDGLAVVDRVAGAIFEHESQLLEHLDSRRRDQLAEMLKELIFSLESAPSTKTPT